MVLYIIRRGLYYLTLMWIPRNMQVWGMKRTIERAFKTRSTSRRWVFFFCWDELHLLTDLNKWWEAKGGSPNPFIVSPGLLSVAVAFQRPLTVQEQALAEQLVQAFELLKQMRKSRDN